MLELQDLHAWYGQSHVLQGVTLQVRPGEIVALLGRNGSGRSTTLKAVMGLVPARGGLRWQGQDLLGRPPFEIARRGVGYVPETRDVFPTLSVLQNLRLGLKPGARRAAGDAGGEASGGAEGVKGGAGAIVGATGAGRAPAVDDVLALFPPLRERLHTPAGVLSGGEQQMLSLGRTLMGAPALMLVDEPTEGLAPQVVERVAGFLRRLRERGLATLLVEQKLSIALEVADRCLLMGHGQVVYEGTPAALRADAAVRREWLEV